MIETSGLTKRFDDILAVDHISAKIRDGSVFGLIGTNGAGKSTFLRMVSGILKPDEGEVLIDGENVYENPAVKSRFFYISDDQYFFANGTPLELMKFYKSIYPAFDEPRFFHLLQSFDLDKKRKISTFSKGMKKQLSILYGICAGTDYIFCDETFDGLDPVHLFRTPDIIGMTHLQTAVKAFQLAADDPLAAFGKIAFQRFRISVKKA